MERLNPLNDFVFKKLFGEKGKENNLKALLKAVLTPKDANNLDTVEIIENKELTRELINDKTSILDVRAKLNDGTQLDIEVQLTNQHNMEKRTLFYWGRLFNDTISKGEDYKSLKKVITINILNFDFTPIENYHSVFHLWEDSVKDYMLTDIIELHFLELSKFRRLKEKDYANNPLHRWLAFLEEKTLKDVGQITQLDNDILNAERDLEYLSSDEKIITLYRSREDSLREARNIFNSGKEEGEVKGQINGLIRGLILYLGQRFDDVPNDIVDSLNKLTDVSVMDNISKDIYKSNSIKEVKVVLDKALQ